MVYENENFNLSQDWELPIPGFMVLSPKKCVDTFNGLSKEERIEIFEIVNKTIEILRDTKICDRFNVIFEEKENRYLHIWIMPRQEWMIKLAGNITNNIGQIFAYAKRSFRNEEIYFR